MPSLVPYLADMCELAVLTTIKVDNKQNTMFFPNFCRASHTRATNNKQGSTHLLPPVKAVLHMGIQLVGVKPECTA